jgi:hypothetical protein
VGIDVGVDKNGRLFGGRKLLILLMARVGIEPTTHGFSAHCAIFARAVVYQGARK